MKLNKDQIIFRQNGLRKYFFVLFGILIAIILPNKVAAVKLDSAFNPEILNQAAIRAIAVQSNGKFIVAGDFLKIGIVDRNYVARLNTDGSLDETFNAGEILSRSVNDIAIQSDGKIILVGAFLPFNRQGFSRIVRLNEDGSFDSSFNSGTGLNGNILSVQINNAGNGRILIGGGFTSYNGVARNFVARLNSDGSLDQSFNPATGPSSAVRDIRIQPDGNILIGGDFTTVGGTSRNRIARLTSNGSLDTSFNPSTGFNGSVTCLELMSNGSVLVGGTFTTFVGIDRQRIARLTNTGSLDGIFFR